MGFYYFLSPCCLVELQVIASGIFSFLSLWLNVVSDSWFVFPQRGSLAFHLTKVKHSSCWFECVDFKLLHVRSKVKCSSFNPKRSETNVINCAPAAVIAGASVGWNVRAVAFWFGNKHYSVYTPKALTRHTCMLVYGKYMSTFEEY